jgi:tRNA(adenine34) deaminase
MPYTVPPPALDDKTYLRHRRWMLRALELAEAAGNAGEVPVGAVVLGPGDEVLAETSNRRERDQDPTAHAEVLALRRAGRRLGNWHLNHCTLYVTLEPCPMCAGAIVLSRLGLLVYGADDPKAGAVGSVLNVPASRGSNHRLPVLAGLLADPCREQLQQWFAQRRNHLARQS